ncbi:MAG TPA: BON domain-containing protein [Ktedonobacterales bacterium]|jgi:osmotically-inducible protein OsmY|nr:BON domain-containing protein [Ktedonobacterales bacterium]
MAEDTLVAQLQQHLRETVSNDITVGASEDSLYLSGRVQSKAERQLAEEIARELSGGLGVENDLVVERLLPEDRIEVDSPDLGEAELFAQDNSDEDLDDEGNPLEPDFTSQPLETNDLAVIDQGEFENEPPEDDPDPSYFAPTDPVVGRGGDGNGNIIVEGGFEPTAMEDLAVDRSAEDNAPGDEALADAVRDALARDASTEALNLRVSVNAGAVRIHGRVPDLEDAENAESVASGVPGVRDVIDDTTVENI